MHSFSASSESVLIQRARPWLGTIASLRAYMPPACNPDAAIEDAFDAIAEVQCLMSVFDADSDLTRLHAQVCGQPFDAHPLTAQVVAFALELAEATDGLFDPAIGGDAVARGSLPRPIGARYSLDEVQDATWRDVELDANRLVLRRPLWLDLNGIAKGFAVDRALSALKSAGAIQASVNIGGDLAVFGPQPEIIDLRASPSVPRAQIEINNGAVASSGGAQDRVATRHLHGRNRDQIDPACFAAVIAPDCITADALTKVVLAGGTDTALLARYRAQALHLNAAGEWRQFGETEHG